MWPGIIAAAIGGASTLATNIWNAREARRNREFQERMSSTAHQREMVDLRKAGINPMMRSLGGADAPSGDRAQMEDVGRGAASAVQARMNLAQLELVKAQARREDANAGLARAQQSDLVSTASFRYDIGHTQALLNRMDLKQREDMLPLLVARAKEEIGLTASTARAAGARAVLDELAKERSVNLAEFEKRIGEAGPWVRLLFETIRTIRR